MGTPLKSIKILWGRAANRCAICRNELVEDAVNPADDESVVGEMAHIIAREETFTRGDYDSLSQEARDDYSNLILLCRRHHKVVDDQPAHYTVDELRRTKAVHEQWVSSTLGFPDQQKQQDDQVYAGIVDEWSRRIDINSWTVWGTLIYSADGPKIQNEYHDALSTLPSWILNRIWPHRYEALEEAFFNFKTVLQDFIQVLNRHLDAPLNKDELLTTNGFYRISEWNPEKYNRLFERWDAHVCLVGNLFTELTRSVNLICERVRSTVFQGFRINEGVLLVQRDMVAGFNSKTYRAEYNRLARQELHPYKGLREFEQTQYAGEFFLRPEHLPRT